jgi:hypothetical protein
MSNVNKQSYAFTALTPIIAGHTEGVQHLAALRAVLAGFDRPDASPFARLPGTHFARFTVLDDVPQLGLPTDADVLQSKYLMLEADFDGSRDAWLDALRTRTADAVTAVYRHCLGFTGVHDAAAFRAYFAKCQLETTLDFSPFDGDTLPAVQRALDTQRRFVGFVHALQGRSAEQLQTEFRRFLAEHATPAPRPGARP